MNVGKGGNNSNYYIFIDIIFTLKWKRKIFYLNKWGKRKYYRDQITFFNKIQRHKSIFLRIQASRTSF